MYKKYLNALIVFVFIMQLTSCSFINFIFGSSLFKLKFDTKEDSETRGILTYTNNKFDESVYGKYIGSITPKKFVIPLNTVIFYTSAKKTNSKSQIEVESARDYINTKDPTLYLANFTDPNVENSYVPKIIPGSDEFDFLVIRYKFSPNKYGIYIGNGTPTDESWNDPTQAVIFYNEPDIVISLPSQYSSVPLNVENQDRVRSGLDLKCRNIESLVENSLGIKANQILDPPQVVSELFFGDEDADYSVYTPPEGSAIGINFGLNQDIEWYRPGFTLPIIRGPLKPLVLPTFYSEITVSVHFDISDLIQIYEGPDSAPYTADDIFTLAPEFYKRFSVECTTH